MYSFNQLFLTVFLLLVACSASADGLQLPTGELPERLYPFYEYHAAFIDYDGNEQIRIERCTDLRPLSEGLAAFRRDGKWGFVNRRGEVVIQPAFHWAGSFHDGRARVRVEVEGLPPRPEDNSELKFKQGDTLESYEARLAGNLRYGFIDTGGNWAIEPEYVRAWDFHDGLAGFAEGNNVGFLTPMAGSR